MAGDWIKMRTSLLTNPKVNGIARYLEVGCEVSRALSVGHIGDMNEVVTRNVMRHVTVSSLLIVWGAANEHTNDGVFKNADLSDIDDMVGIPGFGEAMALVGWAAFDEESNCVILPNFNEYNTVGSSRSIAAKSSAQRQKEYRDRKKLQTSDVTRDVTNDVTSDRREEKRREEVNLEAPPTASPAPKVRATRLSADWLLPNDWKTWAIDEQPTWTAPHADRVAEGFRDYWIAKAGKDGAKLDWEATWRNWVRRQGPMPASAHRPEDDWRNNPIFAGIGK